MTRVRFATDARNSKADAISEAKSPAVAFASTLNCEVTNARGARDGDGLTPSDKLDDLVADSDRVGVREILWVGVGHCDQDIEDVIVELGLAVRAVAC